jgi:hypothetical protein
MTPESRSPVWVVTLNQPGGNITGFANVEATLGRQVA